MIKEKDKFIYLQLLRILAVCAVIMIHVIAASINNYKVKSVSWIILVTFGSWIRWCIPLFFMISGCLFLNKTVTVIEMIKKYIFRLACVLVVWGLIYYFFDCWIYNLSVFNIKNIILALFCVGSGNTGYHLWFLYDMILVYLAVPILKCFVDYAEQNLLKYVLVLFIVFGLIITYYDTIITNISILSDVVKINLALPELVGYIGCFYAGYYLKNCHIDDRARKMLKIICLAGCLIMPIGNMVVTIINGSLSLVFSDYNGLFSVAIAAYLFLSIQNKEEKLQQSKIKSIILDIGRNTFGIYLVHVFFVSIIFHKLLINWEKSSAVFVVAVGTIVVFMISYGVTRVLNKIPAVKKLV